MSCHANVIRKNSAGLLEGDWGCCVCADNIKLFGGDYYLRRTLVFSIGTGDPLLKAFRKRKTITSEVTHS